MSGDDIVIAIHSNSKAHVIRMPEVPRIATYSSVVPRPTLGAKSKNGNLFESLRVRVVESRVQGFADLQRQESVRVIERLL